MILTWARHSSLSPRQIPTIRSTGRNTSIIPPRRRGVNLRKLAILFICAFYSFLGNASLLGPSVYIAVWAEQFGIDFGTSSGLISYSNLAYGFGSLVLVLSSSDERVDDV